MYVRVAPRARQVGTGGATRRYQRRDSAVPEAQLDAPRHATQLITGRNSTRGGAGQAGGDGEAGGAELELGKGADDVGVALAPGSRGVVADPGEHVHGL